MTLRSESIEKFKFLYKDLMGVELSDEECVTKAEELIAFHLLLLDPNINKCYD